MADQANKPGNGQQQQRPSGNASGIVPPHNLDAEAAVLSTLMLKPEALGECRALLREGVAFYSVANRRICEAVLGLWDADSKIDSVTVGAWLREKERLQQVGGLPYLAQLIDATPAVAHVEAHARIVFDCWRRRQAIAVAQEIAALGYGLDHSLTTEEAVQAFIDGSADKFLELSTESQRKDLRSLSDVLKEAGEILNATKLRGSTITGMRTGLNALDEALSGLQASDLYIVAGRPAMGKSACVMRMLTGLAASGEPSALFSLEMPDIQIAQRLIAASSRVELNKIRNANMQPTEWSAVTQALVDLAKLPLWIDDSATLTLGDMRARVRKFNAKRRLEKQPQLRVVAVDYLQLMDSVYVKGKNREQEVAENSRGLKRMAKDDKLAIIALSQLSREVEKRGGDKRPMLSDLRSSGAIEQDADTVMFVHRAEYYTKPTEQPKEDVRNKAEIIIAKQRNGPTKTIDLFFDGATTRFENLARDDNYEWDGTDDRLPKE